MRLFSSLTHTYKYIIFISLVFAAIIWTSNVLFDELWGYRCRNPVVDLEELYAAPTEYNNFPRINLKLLNSATLCIEGNQKFITLGSNKEYSYYDTIKINKPDSLFLFNNEIFLKFLNTDKTDSLLLVISQGNEKGIFSSQIFYSSVKINHLNKFSTAPENFRLNTKALVYQDLLKNNDTLIQQVINYFNLNKNSLGLAECGTNSRILKSVCDKFKLPGRIIILQGGDSFEAGVDDRLGYPKHAVCEVYSSKFRKWYVIDPMYGTVFKKDHVPQNAAEISDLVFAGRVSNIIQDSVFATRSETLKNNYFSYYRNIYYTLNISNGFFKFFVEHFYGNYLYFQLQNTHRMHNYMDGRMYCALKTLMYLILSILYVFIISYGIRNRLYSAEMKKGQGV